MAIFPVITLWLLLFLPSSTPHADSADSRCQCSLTPFSSLVPYFGLGFLGEIWTSSSNPGLSGALNWWTLLLKLFLSNRNRWMTSFHCVSSGAAAWFGTDVTGRCLKSSWQSRCCQLCAWVWANITHFGGFCGLAAFSLLESNQEFHSVKQFIVPTLRPVLTRGPIKIVQCLLIITQSNFSVQFWFI